MKKSFLQIVRYLAFLALGIILLYFAFRKVNFSEMISILGSAKYSWVLLSLFLSILAFISRAKRWTLIIEPLGHKPGLWNTLNSVLFGYLANYALPRMGEVSKCIALNRKEKIPVDALIGTVVLERSIDLLSLFVIIIILLIARFEKFGHFFREYILNNLSSKAAGIIGNGFVFWLILVAVLLSIILVLYVFRQKLSRLKIIMKIRGFLKSFVEGFKTILVLKKKWEFFFHTVFIWTCYALMTWVVVFALPDITGDLKFSDGIFLLVIGSLGMAAPVQAGIGAFQWIVSKGLVTIYGLGETEAQSFASLQYFSQTSLVILLGSLATLILFTKLGNIKRKELSQYKILESKTKGAIIPEDLRKQKKVVFTNGCFDILHPGHNHLLDTAKKRGDLLVVGLNSDASVSRLKGPSRPINKQETRAKNLAKIKAVDYVIIFEDDTPEKLIRKIKPDILIKGGDYKKDEIVGSDFVLSYGGVVDIVPLLEGHSTTEEIKKLKKS